MAITRTQIARQLYDNGGDVLGPLGEEDNLQSGFISGVKSIATPGNIGRGLAFVLSGGLTSVPSVAKEIAKQKVMDTIMQKSGDIIGPKIQTELMQQDNRARGIGGYQSSFGGDSGFMEGKGTAAEMASFADGGRIGYQEGGGSTNDISLEEAKDMAPKGEFLAYINEKEAKMLKDAGGSGIMTNAGIPSFVEYGGQSGFDSAKSTGSVQGDIDRGGGPTTNVGGGVTNIPSKKDIPIPNTDFTRFDKNLINLGFIDPTVVDDEKYPCNNHN